MVCLLSAALRLFTSLGLFIILSLITLAVLVSKFVWLIIFKSGKSEVCFATLALFKLVIGAIMRTADTHVANTGKVF
ncbi:hypothetical protein DIPPA_19346 [Diplonema papillatum]|nr:hypothetical protein DIPPA_19346 [Diplonema papillatum]